ncbi:hypothetical protein OO006_12055 [Prosthecochloris sp. SCSIO W1101]|uniref:hypothetical protein n=1 Tax=Prosthecochloris sp. SCSIO W1101 TaxID=2992242 RepID=UPI00223D2D77|nr:hypothetical protein [Prosthecochloris sp. SCSIO W1101]UZJ41067.1 hypothetical protein OO006_12055 [Prosthecochloris sp. SCSIO W1101]
MNKKNTKNKGITEKIYLFISHIFAPYTNSSIALAILIIPDKDILFQQKILYLIIGIFFSSLLPIFFLLWAKKRKIIDSLEMKNRKANINLLFFGVISYLICYLLLNFFGSSLITQGFMLSLALNTSLFILITHFWRISIHAMGISVPTMAIHFAYGNVAILGYLLIFIVSFSRFMLNRHSLSQILSGIFLSLSITYIQLKYFLL